MVGPKKPAPSKAEGKIPSQPRCRKVGVSSADSQWLFMTLPQFCWPTTPNKIIKPILGNMPKQDKWSPTSDHHHHHQHHQQASNPSSYPFFIIQVISSKVTTGDPSKAPPCSGTVTIISSTAATIFSARGMSRTTPTSGRCRTLGAETLRKGSPRYNQTLVLTRESHRKPRKKTQENGESSKNLWSGFNYST